jgi:hypothetical protein
MSAFNFTTKLVHHYLLAVTDAQDRQPHIEQTLRRTRRTLVQYAGWSTGQDNRFGGEISYEVFIYVLKRMDFTIDIALTQAARDQLRYL